MIINEYFGRVLKVLSENTDIKIEVVKVGECYFELYINDILITEGDDESMEKRLMQIARERGLTPLSVWE